MIGKYSSRKNICSYLGVNFPYISTITNPSGNVAVFNDSRHTFHLISVFILKFCISALSLLEKRTNPILARWFIPGVSLPVYSKRTPSFQSLLCDLVYSFFYILNCHTKTIQQVAIIVFTYGNFCKWDPPYHYLSHRNHKTLFWFAHQL